MLISSSLIAQTKLIGKYQAWFDICDRDYSHFCIQLDIDSAGMVYITYRDDTQIKTSKGKIKVDKDTVLLTPIYERDSVVIEQIIDRTLNKKQLKRQDELEKSGHKQTVKYLDSIDLPIRYRNNLIRLINGFSHPISNQELTFFYGEEKRDYVTDSLGRVIYKKQIPDSITYQIKGYEFCIKPDQENNPSWIKVYMDLNNKNMINDYFDNTSLKIMNGFMVWSWECPEKRVIKIFKPINN